MQLVSNYSDHKIFNLQWGQAVETKILHLHWRSMWVQKPPNRLQFSKSVQRETNINLLMLAYIAQHKFMIHKLIPFRKADSGIQKYGNMTN